MSQTIPLTAEAIAARLKPEGDLIELAETGIANPTKGWGGDHALNKELFKGSGDPEKGDDWTDLLPPIEALKPAAVLVPLVRHQTGLTMLLTKRSSALPSHRGQVAFPGGRVDPGDAHPIAAALREAEEEVALDPSTVDIIGLLNPYLTGSGYRIMPVVGLVDPPKALKAEEAEVEAIFEVPLSFLMDDTNHEVHSMEFQGKTRRYYAMPYENWYIWGATAGMIKDLYRRLSI